MQVAHDARIDVAAAGAHHQALQRSQSHRGIHGATAGDRRRGGTVTQMQHNLIQSLPRSAQEGRGLLADVAMRGPVKSVPPDMPLLRQLAIDRVGRGGSRQIVEERGVEHRDMRHIRQHRAGDLDALEGGRIVQRGQHRQLLELRDDRVIDDGRPVEDRPAVNHPVTDRGQPGRFSSRCRRRIASRMPPAVPRRGR